MSQFFRNLFNNNRLNKNKRYGIKLRACNWAKRSNEKSAKMIKKGMNEMIYKWLSDILLY
jgi:hypothetical protein